MDTVLPENPGREMDAASKESLVVEKWTRGCLRIPGSREMDLGLPANPGGREMDAAA
jgi:hypothetical protein